MRPVVKLTDHFFERLLLRFGLVLDDQTRLRLMWGMQDELERDPAKPEEEECFFDCRIGSTRFTAVYRAVAGKVVTCIPATGPIGAYRHHKRQSLKKKEQEARKVERQQQAKRRDAIFADQRRSTQRNRWKQRWVV